MRAKSDPEGFGRLLFAEMAALNGFLLLRTQVLIIDRVVGRGPFDCQPSLGDLSADVVEAAARFTAASGALLRRLLATCRRGPTGTGEP